MTKRRFLYGRLSTTQKKMLQDTTFLSGGNLNSELDRKGRPLWFSASVYLTYLVRRWDYILKVSDFECLNAK